MNTGEDMDDISEYKEYKAGLQEFAKLGGGKDNALLLFMNFGKDCSAKVAHVKKEVKPKKQIKKDMPKDISPGSILSSSATGGSKTPPETEESPSEYYDVNE